MAWPASNPAALALILISALLAALICAAVLRYALNFGLVDQPGRRRSHTHPTPRGGGLGPVVVLIVLLPWWLSAVGLSITAIIAVSGSASLLAAISFVDDHRPLSPWSRLTLHLLAACCVGFAVVDFQPTLAWIWLLLIVPACVWSINLHNFMDGSNGLLGLQLMWVMSAYLVLAALNADAQFVVFSACALAAVAAFIPFNFPRARVFMGDVGSATLGLLVALIAVLGWSKGLWSIAELLVIHSAFVVDASLTLLWRVASGRRWYSAHREHLFQWWLRGGVSHASVAMRFLLWNLVVCLPVLVLMSLIPEFEILVAGALLVAAAVLWRWERRRQLRSLRTGCV